MPDNKQDPIQRDDRIQNPPPGRQINQPNKNDQDFDQQSGQHTTKQGGKSDKMEEPMKNRDTR